MANLKEIVWVIVIAAGIAFLLIQNWRQEGGQLAPGLVIEREYNPYGQPQSRGFTVYARDTIFLEYHKGNCDSAELNLLNDLYQLQNNPDKNH